MKRLVMVLLILASPALAEPPRPAIVLVHGAFADASGWSRVIPILQRDGYFVTAVQIPSLRSPTTSRRRSELWTHRKGRSSWWATPTAAR